MSDTSNPYAAGFFFAGEPGANLKMREKMALAMMMRKASAPKNLGEGIYSFGDSIGDAIMARQLQQQDRDAQLAAAKLGAPADPGAITPVAAAPGEDVPQETGPKPMIAATQPAPTSPSVVPPQQQPIVPPAAPAKPLPPDQQQSYEPGAPVRLSSPEQLQDFRGQNPLPRGLPPVPGAAAPIPARPSVADFGQKPVLAPTPPPGAPVVAQGGEDDPRRAIALTMLRQGQAGQPQGQAFAPAAPPPAPAPAPDRGIAAASPVPDQGIRQAPPVQVAQNEPRVQPGAVSGYVPPVMPDPTGAPIIGPSKREVELKAVLAANQGNPYAEQSPAARELKALEAVRAQRQNEANKLFEAGVTRSTKREEQRQQGLMDQSKRIVEVEKEREAVTEARQKNTLRAQFGNMPPDEVFKNVTESHKVANSAAKSLQASQAAMAAFDAPGGVITGSGANMRLDVAKFFTQMGLVDKGNVIANTETFRNAMAPVVASIMHQTSGTSQLSEGELRFAQRAAAGDITLDPGSIKQLMSIIDKGSKGIIADHQRKVDVLFGDSPQAKATFGVEAPRAPEKAAPAVSDGATATGPGGKKMIMRGGNWEPL